MNGSGQPDFAAVLVTYGQRLDLVETVVNQLLIIPRIRYIIIVDNDSEKNINISDSRVTILRQPSNIGSAGGYNIGINHAKNLKDADFIVLLDDDLVPSLESIEGIIELAKTSPDNHVFIIPRNDRPGQRRALERGNAPTIIRNSFHDFHIAKFLFPQNRKIPHLDCTVPVDFAPYGGMVIRTCIAKHADLPDREMFLYCDDYDYAMKLKRSGANLMLCDVPSLNSIDTSWNQKRTIAPAAFDPIAPSFRVYYATRNRVLFERRYIVNVNWIYLVNAFVFLTLSLIVSSIENRQIISRARARLLCAAITHGWKHDTSKSKLVIDRLL